MATNHSPRTKKSCPLKRIRISENHRQAEHRRMTTLSRKFSLPGSHAFSDMAFFSCVDATFPWTPLLQNLTTIHLHTKNYPDRIQWCRILLCPTARFPHLSVSLHRTRHSTRVVARVERPHAIPWRNSAASTCLLPSFMINSVTYFVEKSINDACQTFRVVI